jgi:hypothetical protein
MRILRRPLVPAVAVLAALAAAPSLRADSFERFYGESGLEEHVGVTAAVRNCPSGGFITVGSNTDSSETTNMIHAVRVAANGTTLWQKTYSLPDTAAASSAVDLRDGSGLVLAGSQFNFDTGASLFLLKVDCNGTPVWANTYFNLALPLSRRAEIVEAFGGDLVVAGNTIEPETSRGLLLRVDASGVLVWSQVYDGSGPTHFNGIIEASRDPNDRDRDLVVVGDHASGSDTTGTVRPFVVRVGADGRLADRRHCAAEYQSAGAFAGATALSASRFAGEFVLAGFAGDGQTPGNMLLVRTHADVCRPAIERVIVNDVAVDVSEVKRALPGTPRGSLAVASTSSPTGQGPRDLLLLTVAPSTLVPMAGHLFGDHGQGDSPRGAFAGSVLPEGDGFVVSGLSFGFDADFNFDEAFYVVKTDPRGHGLCDVPLLPSHQEVQIQTAPVQLSLADAGLVAQKQTDIFVQDNGTIRNACH